jgi:hypothetical protein
MTDGNGHGAVRRQVVRQILHDKNIFIAGLSGRSALMTIFADSNYNKINYDFSIPTAVR